MKFGALATTATVAATKNTKHVIIDLVVVVMYHHSYSKSAEYGKIIGKWHTFAPKDIQEVDKGFGCKGLKVVLKIDLSAILQEEGAPLDGAGGERDQWAAVEITLALRVPHHHSIRETVEEGQGFLGPIGEGLANFQFPKPVVGQTERPHLIKDNHAMIQLNYSN